MSRRTPDPTPSAPTLARGPMRQALLGGGRGPRLALVTAASMTHQACEAAVPVLLGVIIDRAILPGDPQALLRGALALILVFALLTTSYRWAMRQMVAVYGFAENDLRQGVLSRVLAPRGAGGGHGPGSLLTLTTSDTYRVAGVAWSVVSQASALAAIGSCAVVLLGISVPLGLGALAATALVLVVMTAISRPLEERGRAEQAGAAAAGALAADLVAGLRILQGIGAGAEAARRYRTASGASRQAAVAAARSLQGRTAISQVVSALVLAALALAAGWSALRGTISLGELVAVVGLAQLLQLSLGQVGGFAPNWIHKRASARRLQDLLDAPRPDAPRADAGIPAGGGAAPGSDEPLLRWAAPDLELALEARRGELIGIDCGRELAQRISARLALEEIPSPGELLLSGTDALDLDLERLRSRILAPPHEAALFTGTLHEAIDLHEKADPAQVAALVDALGLDDALQGRAARDRQIGEGGRLLSGGQRQRLLLARALAAPADVLVLDEPVTALDPATEQRIAPALRSPDRTTLVLTDSPVLLAACGRIIRPGDPR